MSDPIRLNYKIPGENRLRYGLVFPPVLSRHRLAECHYLELNSKIENLAPDELADSSAFIRLQSEYEAIGELLFPGIDPGWLTPLSRTHFFLSANGSKVSEAGHLQLGLSNLEKLLGYTEKEVQQEGKKPIIITTGRPDLDIVVDLLMCSYGGQAFEIADRYTLEECLLMLRQTSDRLLGEEAVKRIQRERDREAYGAEAESIRKQIATMNLEFPLPYDFLPPNLPDSRN